MTRERERKKNEKNLQCVGREINVLGLNIETAGKRERERGTKQKIAHSNDFAHKMCVYFLLVSIYK